MGDDTELAPALEALARFVAQSPLTETIAALEHELKDCTGAGVPAVLARRGVSPRLLGAATVLRERLGRINDVIHATAISLVLPEILQPGEILERPSLAAGNDRSRPYDVATNRRVAEFKLARWDGHDAMRKRMLVKDLVQLAAEPSPRAAELYVLGERPLRFLRTTRATVRWGLDRSPPTRRLFEERFGSPDVAIPTFLRGPGARVAMVDLREGFPALFGP